MIASTNESIEIGIYRGVNKKSNTCEKLLGIKIDNKLNLNNTNEKGVCKKVNNKLRASAVATPYMSLEKENLLMNSFLNAQFNYCHLISMLYSRSNNSKTKYLHYRCVRLFL